MTSLHPDSPQIMSLTKLWIEKAIIGLNLCPFAKAVYAKKQIRYVVSTSKLRQDLLQELIFELHFLAKANASEIDTTLLIHPDVLTDFLDYNDFLKTAELALKKANLQGVLQIASFHPQYQFGGTEIDDIANYTNRSPYPLLHLLREDSVSKAVSSYVDVDGIPEKNIQTLKNLGLSGWQKLRIHDA